MSCVDMSSDSGQVRMRHQNLTGCLLSEVCTRYWTGRSSESNARTRVALTASFSLENSAFTQLSIAPLDLIWAIHLRPGKVVVVKFVRGARKVEMVLGTKCILPTWSFWAPF